MKIVYLDDDLRCRQICLVHVNSRLNLIHGVLGRYHRKSTVKQSSIEEKYSNHVTVM